MRKLLEILWTVAILVGGGFMVILTLDENRGMFRADAQAPGEEMTWKP